jgi:hypothetical protein
MLNIVIQPKYIDELYINKDQERIEKKLEIGYKALQKIEVKIEENTNWKLVWTSEGTGTRSDVSVWAPVIKEYPFIRKYSSPAFSFPQSMESIPCNPFGG